MVVALAMNSAVCWVVKMVAVKEQTKVVYLVDCWVVKKVCCLVVLMVCCWADTMVHHLVCRLVEMKVYW